LTLIDRNTTLRYPTAKIGAKAVIEAPDVPKLVTHRSFIRKIPHLSNSLSTPHIHHTYSRYQIAHGRLTECELESDQNHATCDEAGRGNMETGHMTTEKQECEETTVIENCTVVLDLGQGGSAEVPVRESEGLRPAMKHKGRYNEPIL
jgi:hypothetical protein